jgi:hypothetical protein
MENKTYYDPKTKNHDISSQNTNKPNRLIHEKSLYLLQHANNPVDWYPWGAEALYGEFSIRQEVGITTGAISAK